MFFYWRENESKHASLDVMHSFPIHKSLELKSNAVVSCGCSVDISLQGNACRVQSNHSEPV